jgi:hypothetical protein
MQKLDAGRLTNALAWLDKFGQGIRTARELGLPPVGKEAFLKRLPYAEEALAICERVGLRTAIDRGRDVIKALKQVSGDIPNMALHTVTVYENIDHFTSRIVDELKTQYVVCIDPKYIDLLDGSAPQFGNDVFNAFPSPNEDISEAAQCIALGRGTASVMHLMRIAEVGLIALGNAVDVPRQADWGGYIREIDKAIAQKAKSSGARTVEEQFYSESAASFDHLKRAWRNPTMHVDKSYSVERAKEIFDAVKSFMRHLATKISE